MISVEKLVDYCSGKSGWTAQIQGDAGGRFNRHLEFKVSVKAETKDAFRDAFSDCDLGCKLRHKLRQQNLVY